MGNKQRHKKIFDPTDKERMSNIARAKAHHNKYGTVDIDRKKEWLKQRKYAFESIFEVLKKNGYGEFEELEDVGNFNEIYNKILKLIEDIQYYITMPEWGDADGVEVMKILIKAMLEKDRFDSSYLTKANYNREAESIKSSIEVIQLEYLERMLEISIKLNQPLPRLTQYHIPLHPNDNYKIALASLLKINLDNNYAENLLEIALDMKNVKSTKHRQRLIKESTNNTIKDLHHAVDDKCSHLPREAQDALKEIIDDIADNLIPKP